MSKTKTSFDSLKKLSTVENTFYLSTVTNEILDGEITNAKRLEQADVIEITVRGLTAKEYNESQAIVNSAIAPKIIEEVQGEQMGTKPVFTGSYDHEDPAYLAEREALNTRRAAYICLKTCSNFSDTPGDNIDQQIDSILESISIDILSSIEQQVRLVSAGTAMDKSAFFLNGDSEKDSISSADSTSSHPEKTQTSPESPATSMEKTSPTSAEKQPGSGK